MRRFPALDGLRAIAAVIVVAFHFGGPRWTWLSGWVGVQLFFVLSGFLITTLMLREEESRGRVSLRSFYIRRVFGSAGLPGGARRDVRPRASQRRQREAARIDAVLPAHGQRVRAEPGVGPHSWTTRRTGWKFYLIVAAGSPS